MVQPGIGLDTPRTNLGDATYLSRAPGLDLTEEPSFQSPAKNLNVFQSLRNGDPRAVRTPPGNRSRAPFSDRINLPGGIGGAEFTPLLKSATRNSARRRGGKENGLATPTLAKIREDLTPVASGSGESSMYRSPRDPGVRTPLMEADSDSTVDTSVAVRRGKAGQGGPLQDGQQLSLREQENVIDKIERENFNLKLKIHFLEEALRKAGPGLSEAALKENTELKVDRVTLQRKLQRYKKHLTSAEKALENYRQQMVQMQELAQEKHGSRDHTTELEKLRKVLDHKEADLEHLQDQIHSDRQALDKVAKLQDEIGDLEADLREKERAIGDRDDELDDLRSKLRQSDDRNQEDVEKLKGEVEDLQAYLREKDRVIGEYEEKLGHLQLRVQQAEVKAKKAQIRMIELEEKAQAHDKLKEAQETIRDLETSMRDLELQVDDAQDKLGIALSERKRAEADLEELQEDMANKSLVTKGLPRQLGDKIVRLQNEIEMARQEYQSLKAQFSLKQTEVDDLNSKLRDSRQERDSAERQRRSLATRLEEVQTDVKSICDEKNLLQSRHDALTAESAALQKDITRLQRTVSDLQAKLEEQRKHSLRAEHDFRSHYKLELYQLNNQLSSVQAEVREKENLYDNDSEKWETERHNLESERDRAEERVLGLQKTIEKLRQAEGSLNDKESKVQQALQCETERHHNEEAVLSRQIDDLQQDLSDRQQVLETLRKELSAVRDELRQAQLEKEALIEKAASLEDKVEVLQTALDKESEKNTQEIETLIKERDALRQQVGELRKLSDSAEASTDASRQVSALNAEAIKQLEKQIDGYKANLFEANQEKRASDRECDNLRQQLRELRRQMESAKASTDASREEANNNSETIMRLEGQLAEHKSMNIQAAKEKRQLQGQIARTKNELHSVRTQLADTQAERDEIDAELQRSKEQGNDNLQIDQERITLKATKVRLEHEVRRLKENNQVLADQLDSLEKTLEDELEKAEAEEERLNQEVLSLQAKLRHGQIPDSQEMTKARRTIRELERKIEDYEHQLAQATIPIHIPEGNSQLSLIKRDLNVARKKELEFMQKENNHKSEVRGLKRQIGDLERRVHEADVTRLAQSPISETASARKAEVSELRHQLSIAHQCISDLKKKLRESDRNVLSVEDEVQRRLQSVEGEKLVLEHALEDAQQAAEEAKSDLNQALTKYKLKADKYKKERDSMAETLSTTRYELRSHRLDTSINSSRANGTVTSEITREERHDLYSILRKTQIDADALEREVREHKEALDELVAIEKALRVKLDRARSERAQYRSDFEKLQREMKGLKKSKDDAEKTAEAAQTAAAVARARVTVTSVSTSKWKGREEESSHSEQRAQVVELEEGDDSELDNAADNIKPANDENVAHVIHFRDENDTQVHTDAIVRAAEAAEHKHVKQMRGMCMQMEWMQARWERELRMRDDAAFAKKYLLLELAVRDTCNQADLAKLEGIFKQLGMKKRPYSNTAAHKESPTPDTRQPFTLKRLAIVLRFVARLRIAARQWQELEKKREMLAGKWESYKREERIKKHQLRFRETRARPAFVTGNGEGMLKGVAIP